MDVSGSYDAPSGPADETGRPAGRPLHDTDASGPAAEHLRADLVLEGGGVKGIALVGATLTGRTDVPDRPPPGGACGSS